jgi:branched-chain amino acid transport system substrate-binding protein
MKKILALVVIAVFLIVILSQKDVSNTDGIVGKEEYVIGTSLALTGPASIFGVPAKQAFEAAATEINADGGVNGVPLRFVFADNKNSGKDGIAAFNQLTTQEDLDIFFTSHSSASVPVSPLAKERGIPLFNTLVYADLQVENDNSFRFFAHPQVDVKNTIDHMKKSGVKKITVLAVKAEYAEDSLILLEGLAAKSGIEIVHIERYEKDAGGDPKTSVLKAEQVEADAVYIIPIVADPIIEELKKLKTDKKIYLNSTAMAGNLPYRNSSLYEGVIMSTVGASVEGSVERKDILAKMPGSEVKDPSLFMTGIGYDAVYLMKEALEANPDPKKFVESVQTIGNFDGVTGSYVIDSRDEAVNLILVTMEEGRVVEVE